MALMGLHRRWVVTGFLGGVVSTVFACNSREFAVTPEATAGGGNHSAEGGHSSNSGGKSASGGTVARGTETIGHAGSGGNDESGGADSSGGTSAVGGTSSGSSVNGGATAVETGGTSATGGAATGGVSLTSGTTSSGGTTATGGVSSTGGTSSTTGGTMATGGTTSTGGATSCTKDDDCASNAVKNLCDVAHKTCVECIPGETACGSGLFCSSTYTCRIGCASNTDCPTGTCDTALNRCTGCTSTAECGGVSGAVECDTTNKLCLEKGCKTTAGCRTGFTCSNGYCKNLTADRFNCGTSGTVCSSANGTASCNTGKCAITCNAGYDNCHTDANDGCETNLTNDASHCSSCTNACTTGLVCRSSACITLTPCTDYCENPLPYTLKEAVGVTAAKFCYSTTGTIPGGGCGGFSPDRTLYINDLGITCNSGSVAWSSVWTSVPLPVNGGYCFYSNEVGSAGWFNTW